MSFRIERTETIKHVNGVEVSRIVEERTFCSECNGELRDARDWSRHRRNHTMGRLYASQWGRRYIDMMSGFLKDEPDKERP